MTSKATDASIAALGGNRPGSDITAPPVTAKKAGAVALYLAGVIEGLLEISGSSDLSPSSTFL